MVEPGDSIEISFQDNGLPARPKPVTGSVLMVCYLWCVGGVAAGFGTAELDEVHAKVLGMRVVHFLISHTGHALVMTTEQRIDLERELWELVQKEAKWDCSAFSTGSRARAPTGGDGSLLSSMSRMGAFSGSRLRATRRQSDEALDGR